MSKKKKRQHHAPGYGPAHAPGIVKPSDHLDPALSRWGLIEVRGIQVTIEQDQVKDWDVVEGITILQSEHATQAEKMMAGVQVLRTLLRGDYERVKAELRKQHDGSLPAEVMTSFIQEVFEKLRPES